ncbi:MAG: hypothetical protein E7549_04845 [Ruminococcaceae bacterium]|nr:hypothetical protein [Oscillospiraceae bacterium]
MAKSRETMPAWEQELEREWDKLGLSEEDRKDPVFQMQRRHRERLATASPEERQRLLEMEQTMEELLYPGQGQKNG